jgi:hypothetical protein
MESIDDGKSGERRRMKEGGCGMNANGTKGAVIEMV